MRGPFWVQHTHCATPSYTRERRLRRLQHPQVRSTRTHTHTHSPPRSDLFTWWWEVARTHHHRTGHCKSALLHGTSFVRQRRRVANGLSTTFCTFAIGAAAFFLVLREVERVWARIWGECILLADAPSVSTAHLCHCQHLQLQTQHPPSPLSGRYHTPKSPRFRHAPKMRPCCSIDNVKSDAYFSRFQVKHCRRRERETGGEFMVPLRPQMRPRRSVQSDTCFSRFQVKHCRRRERETGGEFTVPLRPQMLPRHSVDNVQSDAYFSCFQVKHCMRRERETGGEFTVPLRPRMPPCCSASLTKISL